MLPSKVELKAFISIFFITLVAMSSLLLANGLYSDDFTRVISGEPLWNANGRPLSTFISVALQFGKPLTNISPLPQLFAFTLYSLSAIYLGRLFKVNDLLLLTLSGVIFVINPLNLQNLVFIFDSFPMAVSVFTSTLAAYLISFFIGNNIKIKEKIFIFFSSFFLLICSLCLYQSSISIYLVIFTFYALVRLLDGQLARSFCIISASIIVLLFASIAYIPIKNFYIDGEYTLYHSKTIPLSDFPQKIFDNLLFFWENVKSLLGQNTLSYFIYSLSFLAIVAVIYNIFILLKKASIEKHQITIILILIIFYLVFLIAAPPGLMLILENPIFAPRTMIGFSGLIAIFCLFVSNQVLSKKGTIKTYLQYCLIGLFCLVSLIFSNVSLTLGNAVNAQNVQEEMIITIMMSDLGEIIPKLPITQQPPTLVLVNSINYNYANLQAYQKYPIINSIIWRYLSSNQYQFYTKLKTLGFDFTPANAQDTIAKENQQFNPKTKPLLVRGLYNIYFEDNNWLVVAFKK